MIKRIATTAMILSGALALAGCAPKTEAPAPAAAPAEAPAAAPAAAAPAEATPAQPAAPDKKDASQGGGEHL